MDDKTRAGGPQPRGNVGKYLAPEITGLKLGIVVFHESGADPHRIGLNTFDTGRSHQRINSIFQIRQKRNDLAEGITSGGWGLLDLFDLLRSRMVEVDLRGSRP